MSTLEDFAPGAPAVADLLGSGSYAPDDVTFLLRPVAARFVSVEEKERLIQSGETHYGHLLSPEAAPGPAYLDLYRAALARGGDRLAADVTRLAERLAARPDLVLVSLARAGTPIGVLLRRRLARLGVDAPHYSVSVVRDHGVDAAALDLVAARHGPRGAVFLDGWTGKGVIAREVAASVAAWNARHAPGAGEGFDPTLFVVSDPGGFAGESATPEDYLLPNAMLNATVSGLVSRTLLPAGSADGPVLHGPVLHGAVLLHHLRPHDLSRAFVDDVAARFPDRAPPAPIADPERRTRALAFLDDLRTAFGERPLNHVKPGVGEATRVLLRRLPEALVLRDPLDPDTAHLRALAEERGVPLHVRSDAPYRAVALIRSLDRDP